MGKFDWTGEIASRTWDQLVDFAMSDAPEGGHLIYSKLQRRVAPDCQSKGRHIRLALDPLLKFCTAAKLPLLTVLVANEAGQRGVGYTSPYNRTLQEEITVVRSFDWRTVPHPLRELPEYPLSKVYPADSLTTFSLKNVRGYAQDQFRSKLLRAYGGKCALCDVSIAKLLEAAHLKPWPACTVQEQTDVQNGLLLCGNHHGMLDGKLLQFDPQWAVTIKSMAGLAHLGNRNITRANVRLPRRITDRPRYDYLSDDFRTP